MIKFYNMCTDLVEFSDMTPLPPCEQRHPFLRHQGLDYSDQDIADFEERMRIEHCDGDGVVVFTSQAWGRVFETRGPLVRELILEFLSTLRFREVLLDLDTPGTIPFQLGGAKRRMSRREFILALGLHTGEDMESLDFARYWSESERMIPGKGDLRVRHLRRRFVVGRKSRALISGGQFVARLAEHFGLLTKERLQGLMVTAPALPIIDMDELVRLQIYVEFGDTWAWVPAGLARQEGDARRVTEEALVAPGGGDEDEEMPQAVPPQPKTQGERIARLEEEVHGMCEVLQGQREVLDSMARDFSMFTMWTVTSLSRMMDKAGVTYTRYSESPVEY
ncbi:hypothetical protein Tco_1193838 [Tanacetum coccineum]